MNEHILTDRLLREALNPAASNTAVAELAVAVSDRVRVTPQRRRGFTFSWRVSPAATSADLRRAQLARLVLAVALMAAAVGMVAAGARLLPPPAAPPQWILVRQGQSFSVPFGGGERRALIALAGLQINDVTPSWDGTRLATIRGQRNEVFEIWDAAEVFDDRDAKPVRYQLPSGIRVLDAGVWRRDGSGLLVVGIDHGAVRLYLLTLATGDVSRISPDGVNVDDWQPAPNDRWIEVAGQVNGSYALYLIDLQTRENHTLLESDGTNIPVGGALGWSPDSEHMTVHIERHVTDGGIWTLRPDGTGLRRVTPEGQVAWSMTWSPDGAWITYLAEAANPMCATGNNLMDTWVIRPDGTDAHIVARSAYPIGWADDSRSVIVESQQPRPRAPLGGVIHAYVDGSPPDLIYPYAEADRTGTACHPYGVLTKMYRGMHRSAR
jgi:hypothetical protein